MEARIHACRRRHSRGPLTDHHRPSHSRHSGTTDMPLAAQPYSPALDCVRCSARRRVGIVPIAPRSIDAGVPAACPCADFSYCCTARSGCQLLSVCSKALFLLCENGTDLFRKPQKPPCATCAEKINPGPSILLDDALTSVIRFRRGAAFREPNISGNWDLTPISDWHGSREVIMASGLSKDVPASA